MFDNIFAATERETLTHTQRKSRFNSRSQRLVFGKEEEKKKEKEKKLRKTVRRVRWHSRHFWQLDDDVVDHEGLPGRHGCLHIRSSSKTTRRECHAHPTSLTLFAPANNTNRAAVCAHCRPCTYYMCIYIKTRAGAGGRRMGVGVVCMS